MTSCCKCTPPLPYAIAYMRLPLDHAFSKYGKSKKCCKPISSGKDKRCGRYLFGSGFGDSQSWIWITDPDPGGQLITDPAGYESYLDGHSNMYWYLVVPSKSLIVKQYFTFFLNFFDSLIVRIRIHTQEAIIYGSTGPKDVGIRNFSTYKLQVVYTTR